MVKTREPNSDKKIRKIWGQNKALQWLIVLKNLQKNTHTEKAHTEKAVGGSMALKITQGYTLKFEKHQRWKQNSH